MRQVHTSTNARMQRTLYGHGSNVQPKMYQEHNYTCMHKNFVSLVSIGVRYIIIIIEIIIVIQDTILLLVYMDLFWHKYTLVTHAKRGLVPKS